MGVELIGAGLFIDGTRLPLLSGTMHYWRLAPSVWEECLLKMKDLGFRIVETYVPWSVHEIEDGKFDFGETSPEKDLPAFLRLAAKHGFFVMLRPGPHINAELTDFGFPARVLDNPRAQAAGPEGEPIYMPALPGAFPVPSYCSEHFWAETGRWFDAVALVIAPFLHPAGPIILVQCDNELSWFFRTGAYDQDYSDSAISAYRSFLTEKYGDPAALSNAYATNFRSWSDVLPPTAFRAGTAGELAPYFDWAEFKERVLGDSLARVRRMWEQRGISGVLFSHNIPTCMTRTPFNIVKDERVLDVVGQDHYPHRKDYPAFKKKLLAHEGQSRFPWSPEFSSGCYQLWPPVTLDDQKFTTLVALMYGLKGFNFYMIVERERWYGSPITRRAGIRKDYYDFYKSLLEFIKTQRLDELSREAKVLVLTPRIYDRLEKASTLFGNLTPMAVEDMLGPEVLCDERKLGFTYCIQIEHDRMRRAFTDALDEAGVTWRWGDSESGLELLRRFSIVFCPSFEFMDETLQRELAEYLQLGGTLVMGPEVPSRLADMRDTAILSEFVARPVHKLECEAETLVFNAGAGRVILVDQALEPGSAQARECLGEVFRFLHLSPMLPVDPPCERTVFCGNDRTVVYIANPTAEHQTPGVAVTGAFRLVDQMTREEFHGPEKIRVFMPPWHVRVLELLPC